MSSLPGPSYSSSSRLLPDCKLVWAASIHNVPILPGPPGLQRTEIVEGASAIAHANRPSPATVPPLALTIVPLRLSSVLADSGQILPLLVGNVPSANCNVLPPSTSISPVLASAKVPTSIRLVLGESAAKSQTQKVPPGFRKVPALMMVPNPPLNPPALRISKRPLFWKDAPGNVLMLPTEPPSSR